MADRKPGAVKPPVIDLKAREAGADSVAPNEEKTSRSKPAPEKPAEPPRSSPPPRPQARLAMPWSAIAIAAIAGGALGTALTYGAAALLPLPDRRAEIVDPAPELAALSGEVGTLGTRLDDLEQQTRRTQVSLDATITQLDTGLNTLTQSIADVGSASTPVDLAPLETKISALEDRLAVTAVGSGGDTTELAATLSETETALADLTTKVATLTQQLTDQQTALDTARAAISAQSQNPGAGAVTPAVRLPLLVSAFESAIGNGRPFTTELAAVTALLPDIEVPPEVSAGAAAGLPRPDAVASAVHNAIPTILAGRSAAGSGDLGADAVEWVKGLLAVRPVGEVEGETPEAIVSRLEAAVDRRDFAAAGTLLAALPPAMQAAAGPLTTQVDALAAADRFITSVRVRALGPAT
jgi:hypothetical protein